MSEFVRRLAAKLSGPAATRLEQRRWIHGEARFLEQLPAYFAEAGRPLSADDLAAATQLHAEWQHLERRIAELGREG